MKLISAFFKLIRWPNLLFIILTQVLFYYCILLPSINAASYTFYKLETSLLICLLFSSVFIAAAGYIINDYFDLNIDQVNKPKSIVIQKIIRRRWAIIWHLSLSAAGLLLAFYVSWRINNFLLLGGNSLCVILLWVYSTTFKKKLLIGNIIISLLTAWVILVLYVCELNVFRMQDTAYTSAITRIFKFAVVYSGFAFIISLIREVVKDIEDMAGDERYGCYTLPIAWGVQSARVFIATWLVVLIACLITMQVYAIMLSWWMGVSYSLIFILYPLVRIFRNLFKASSTEHFHKLSNTIKLVMLTGILSMLFFTYYNG